MFQVHDQEKALELFTKLFKSKQFEKTGEAVQIYYLKPETLFCEYADKAAAAWYAEEERRKLEEVERRKHRDQK